MKAIPLTDLRQASLPLFRCRRRRDHVWAEVERTYWTEYKCVLCPATRVVWQ